MNFLSIIIACLGSSGFFALVQFLLSRLFTQRDSKNESAKTLCRLADRADIGDLNDSRIQLLILINHYPENHYAILKEAEHYFCDLHGNSWVAEIVNSWAMEQGVNIDYIKRIHEATLAAQNKKEK